VAWVVTLAGMAELSCTPFDEPGDAAGDEPGSDQVLQAPTSALSRRDGETVSAPTGW
jgi:hypothetical protein